MRKNDHEPDSAAAESDAAEFRAAIGSVRRLPDAPEAPQGPRRSVVAGMRAADERAALAESHRGDASRDADIRGDATTWRRDEVSPETLRKLKRAQFAIEDELDLHLLSEKAAEDLLRSFLAEARNAAHHCVRIVHGKGLHSPQGPVLRGMVERVLGRRADVLAYATAPPAHGGTGAVLALLTRIKPTEHRIGKSRAPDSGD